MIPALIAVGALALSAGAVAADASHHRRPVVEKTVVIEQPAGAAARRHYERTGMITTKDGTVVRTHQAAVRYRTPNMGDGTHNSYDANQG